MRLTSLLERAHVLVGVEAQSKREAFDAMLSGLEREGAIRPAPGSVIDRQTLLDELIEREAKGNTAVGDGLGYPHIRTSATGDFLLALAVLEEGIDYGCPDGGRVDVLIMAIVPPEKNSLLLGVVSAIGEMMSRPELLASLRRANESGDAWRLLDEAGLEIKDSVTAEDIMSRQFVTATAEMSLSDVAAMMHHERLDVLPVTSPDGRLLGEVSASGLFASTMPRYFAEMPSMGFIKDFDAFEHFFREKASLPVSKILHQKPHRLKPDAPLAEIVARLAKPEIAKLYVVDGERLIGVIDNFSLIDKVLSI